METETVTLPVSEIQRLLQEQGKTTGRNCWIITFRPTWARTFPGEQAHLMVPKTQSRGCQWSCLIICSGVLWKSNKNASGGCRGGEGTTNGLSFLPGPLGVAVCVWLPKPAVLCCLMSDRRGRNSWLVGEKKQLHLWWKEGLTCFCRPCRGSEPGWCLFGTT